MSDRASENKTVRRNVNRTTKPATEPGDAELSGADPVTLEKSAWHEDVLGEGFEQRTLPLGKDSEGPVVATLVRHLPQKTHWWQRLLKRGESDLSGLLDGVDVLYVHGWSDYFFQTRLAEFFTDRGARFFALDLRKYGRSLRRGQTPGFISDLKTYDHEIELALEVMGETVEKPRKLLLCGHSTGGLVLSLWANRNPGRVDGLILNSPWIALQVGGSLLKSAVSTVVGIQAAVNPLHTAPQFDYGYYSRAQAECADPDDPYETNELWRPKRSQPVHAAWLNAIIDGHKEINEHLDLTCPIYALLSLRSELPLRWSEALTRADTVLDVNLIAEALTKLGTSVTIDRIDGALHDVFLSAHEPRESAYARLDDWVHSWAALHNNHRGSIASLEI
jgi:alpha-beta hydrolase superfamily lysophospholipase